MRCGRRRFGWLKPVIVRVRDVATSAAKARLHNKSPIAALKRCATQNQQPKIEQR
jgi:hypothetical protein